MLTSNATEALSAHPELAATLALQRQAHRAHPMPTLQERRRDLDALKRYLLDNQEGLLAALQADYGHRSRHDSLVSEFAVSLSALRHNKSHLRRWMRVQRRGIDRLVFGLACNRVIPQPLGCVGVIVPWNFPLTLSIVPLASIFAAGNRAMVKMSENSRALSRFMIQTLPAYFPPEKLTLIEETGNVGVAFSQLPFDHLFFTGSSQTGRAVMRAAADHLCPVTLELGGKSPAVILPDFDVDVAAQRIIAAKGLNAGQICINVDHVYVPRDRVDDFVEAARRHASQLYPSLSSEHYTSIINERFYQRLKSGLEAMRTAGARVVPLMPGDTHDDAGHRLALHAVVGAPDDCNLMQEEIFGPILPIIPYDRLTDVISRIQAGPHPLAFYPFSHDRAHLDHLIEHVMSGGVTINDAMMHIGQENLPFGGVGNSGMGHYHGWEGFQTFSKMRPVFHQSRWPTTGLLKPGQGRLVQWLIRYFAR